MGVTFMSLAALYNVGKGVMGMTQEGRFKYVGTVLFRIGRGIRNAGRDISDVTYAVTIPKEVALRLNWRLRDRIEVWVDEERELVVLKRLPVRPLDLS